MANNEVRQAFLSLINSQIPNVAIIGKVLAVNGQTCEVLPNGAEASVKGVRLMATIDENDEGVLVTPVKGSFVAITYLDASEGAEAVVVMYSEIEVIVEKGKKATFKRDLSKGKFDLNLEEFDLMLKKFTINNGTNGGLVNIEPLKQDLTKIQVFLSTLVAAIAGAAITPGDGGAAFKSALSAAISTLPLPLVSGLEDKKITH